MNSLNFNPDNYYDSMADKHMTDKPRCDICADLLSGGDIDKGLCPHCQIYKGEE
jgi:hypothetical protein